MDTPRAKARSAVAPGDLRPLLPGLSRDRGVAHSGLRHRRRFEHPDLLGRGGREVAGSEEELSLVGVGPVYPPWLAHAGSRRSSLYRLH